MTANAGSTQLKGAVVGWGVKVEVEIRIRVSSQGPEPVCCLNCVFSPDLRLILANYDNSPSMRAAVNHITIKASDASMEQIFSCHIRQRPYSSISIRPRINAKSTHAFSSLSTLVLVEISKLPFIKATASATAGKCSNRW